MNMKTILATFMLTALTALTLPFEAEAVGTKGDIYSITPYYDADVGRTFKAGETIKFRVRLLASDWDTTKPSAWVARYVGLGSDIIADAMFPPRLGLVISGQLRKAGIVGEEFVVSSTDDTAYVFTDLICAYTVQSGDLALPALLALAGSTEDKPITVGDVAATTDHYFVDNANLWQYVNATSGDACQFFYMDTTEANSAWAAWRSKTKPAVDKQLVDKDLTKANFLVKGVDFDRDPTHEEKAQDGTAHWRVVRQGKESVKGTPAPIVTSGTPQESVTLYVWSENEDVVRMAGDAAKVNFPTNREGTLTVERWVTTITTEQGKSDYALAFEGKQQGKSAMIVMSPVFGYDFDQGGKRVNYITTQVYCDEPEKPNAQISFSETSVTKYLIVDTSMETVDTLKNSAIPVYITLSEPSPDPIDVWLVISNKTNVACDPITNQNIAVLQTEYFVETDEAYTNFTLDAYQTTAKVYVYPIGGTDDSQDKGIDIGLKLDANAAEHYKEKVDPLNLKIRRTHTPVIVSPVAEDDFGQRSTGIDGFPVNIQVSDCYRDLQARPFEVSVTYSDMSTMTTNVFFKAGLDTQIQLKGYGVNATYANITVTDPVGNVSKPVKILFAVKPQKTVSATLYDSTSVDSRHDGESFEEGSTAYVQFSLSQELPYGADRWAFLVPQNEASSNLVECAAFAQGVKIPGGVTNSTLVACALTMLDGCAETRQGELLYRIMLRTAETLTEGEEDTTYVDAKGLQFEVVNVKPLTKGVYVNGAIDPAPQGELWPIPVPSGEAVNIPFTVKATDVSINDQTNLVSVWCVTEGRAPRQSNIYYTVPFTDSVETATLEHSFTFPLVEQTVQVITLDKDLLKEILPEATPQTLTAEQVAKSWASFAKRVAPYEFRVTVEDAPHVVVELVNFNEDASMDEKGNGGTAKVRVSLSYPATTDVDVELALKPLSAADPGNLTFRNGRQTDANYNPDGVTTLTVRIPKNSLEPSSKEPVYNKGTGIAFMYDLINGTAGSENDGWDVTAKVVTPAWADYYESSEGNYFIVRNLTPTVKPAQPAEGDPITTNKTVSIGKAFDIVWTPGDVLADLKATWPGTANKGLKCEWYINDAYQAGKTTYVTCGPDNRVAQQTTSITLNDEGLSVVKLVITDIDGENYRGVTERTWYYYASPIVYKEQVGDCSWSFVIRNGEASIENLSSVAIPQSMEGALTIPSILGGCPVTSIGEGAFRDCDGLTSVTIPASVTSIGKDAFSGCTGMQSYHVDPANTAYCSPNGLLCSKDGSTLIAGINGDVVIPECVTNIGDGAFWGCQGLSSVTIPEGVTNIGDHAFCGCRELTTVTIPSSVTSIGDHAFEDCYGITSITIPEGVTDISDFSFRDCCGLESVVIPEGVTNVGDFAFESCSRLTSLTLPSQLTNIGASAFSGCVRLPSVTIPQGVTSIGERAFERCLGLAVVTIPEGVRSIGSEAFMNCDGLATLAIPSSVTNVGGRVIDGCNSLRTLTIPAGVCGESADAWYAYSFAGVFGWWFLDLSVIIPDGVTCLGMGTFADCSGLTSVTIPSSMTDIGRGAFDYCSDLSTVYVENGDRDRIRGLLEASDFDVSSVQIVEKGEVPPVTTHVVTFDLGVHAERCGGGALIQTVVAGESAAEPDIWEDDGWRFDGWSTDFSCVTNDIVVTAKYSEGLRDGVYTRIVDGVELVFVIEKGVVKIENSSSAVIPYDTTGSLNIPSVLEGFPVVSIGDYAFSDCYGLTSITIPSSVRSIGDYAFDYCEGLTSVTIPEGVTSIGNCAFECCYGLTSIKIPSSVTSIGDEAFECCEGLTSATIPEGVTSIGARAFSDCSELTSITIPSSVTSIGFMTFYGCYGLTTITVAKDNADYCSVDGMLLDRDKTTLIACPSGKRGTVVIPSSVTSIGEYAFGYCDGLTSIEIPSSVTSIGDHAFAYCERLASVTIPSSVTSIGSWAFGGCPSLKTVYVDSGDAERLMGLCDWYHVGTVKFVEIVFPVIGDDPGAVVSGNPETGFVIRSSKETGTVEVSVPQDMEPDKVTVEVSPKVESVKPNGAKVKIVSGGADVTLYLDIPGTRTCDGGGVVATDTDATIELTKAKVKESVVKAAMDPENGADIKLNAANPTITTAVTIPGLIYTFREGTSLEGLGIGEPAARKVGDGTAWTPEISVKGGNSAFYSIGVGLGE